MKRHHRIATIAALTLAACLLVQAPAWAGEENEELEAEATVAAQTDAGQKNPDSAKYEEYRDLPNGILMEHFRLLWKPKDRWFLEAEARDATQRDQSGKFVFGMDKYFKFYLDWRENPRRFMDQGFSPYGASGGTFTLPLALQAAIQAAPAGDSVTPGTKAFLLKDALISAPVVDVDYQRTTGTAGFEATPGKHWLIRLEGARETRLGSMPQTLVFGSSPGGSVAEIAAPVDWSTETATGNVEYRHEYFSLGAIAAFSSFSNEYETLVIDNPLRSTDSASGPTKARMTIYPDNSYEQFRFYATGRLPFWSTRLYASMSSAETRQNEPFNPFTINTAYVAGNNNGTWDAGERDWNNNGLDDDAKPDDASTLPIRSLHGLYKTDTQDLRLSMRPLDWLRMKAWWRSYERDDRSSNPRFRAGYVTGDSGLSGTCANSSNNLAGAGGACEQDPTFGANTPIQRRRLPYDYEKTNWGAGLRFGPFGPAAFGAEYEKEDVDRHHAAAEKSEEEIYKLTADLDVTKWLFFRGTWKDQSREAHDYHAHYGEEGFPIGESYGWAFNEGIRRFYWADRDRSVWNLLADFTPHEKVSLYGEVTYASNKYFDPNTGRAIGGSYTDESSGEFPDGIGRDCDGDDADDNGFADVAAGGDNATTPATPRGDCNILLAGRTKDRSRSWTAGVAFTPVNRFHAYADYTREKIRYGMASRYRNIITTTIAATPYQYGTDDPRDNWGTDFTDEYDTWSLGFNAEVIKDKTRVDGIFTYASGRDSSNTWYAPGGSLSGDGVSSTVTTPLEFPVVRTKLTTAMLTATHQLRRNVAIGLRWWYEKWEDDNWAVDLISPFMGDDAIPGVDNGHRTSVYLGGNFKDYDVHVIQFFVRVMM